MEEISGATALIMKLIGAGTFLLVIHMLRGFVITALSLALPHVLLRLPQRGQQTMIRYLTNENLTLRALYEELKEMDEQGAFPETDHEFFTRES